jgi:hypothetical protein
MKKRKNNYHLFKYGSDNYGQYVYIEGLDHVRKYIKNNEDEEPWKAYPPLSPYFWKMGSIKAMPELPKIADDLNRFYLDELTQEYIDLLILKYKG